MSRCRSDLIELRCPVCGKPFFPLEGWVYRRGDRDLCSYGCTLAYDAIKRREELNALVSYKRTLDAISITLNKPTRTVAIVAMMRARGIRVGNYKKLWNDYIYFYDTHLIKKKEGYIYARTLEQPPYK